MEALGAAGDRRRGGTTYDPYVFYVLLKLDPRNARAETELGLLKESRGREAEAEKHYCKAVADDARYAKARFLLGELYVKRKRRAEGLRLFEAGLKIAPGDPVGSLHLAIAYLEDGRGEEALRLVPRSADRGFQDSGKSPAPPEGGGASGRGLSNADQRAA